MTKPCKLCDKKRYANTSFCWEHFREREKLNKELKEARKKERKLASKGYQENIRKKLKKIAWRLQSEWIRRKDANPDGFVECYTCDSVLHYTKANAGHFKHDRLDHDDRNLKVQCVKCNMWNSGELDIYAERLIRDYGVEWFNQLCKDSWSHNGYSAEDYSNIIKDLKEKLSNLK